MESTMLGRTGLEVSVAGLGCGGFSRIGVSSGVDESAAARLVRHAVELGVKLIDTAPQYGTEPIVGRAVEGIRDEVVISTKFFPTLDDGRPAGAGDLEASVRRSLAHLRTDRIDVLHLHGVPPELYDHCVDEFLPALQRLREAGVVRAIGVTERFPLDTSHEMLRRAVADGYWDVVMVGFNVLNPSARRTVFPLTREHGVGTLGMFAVRRALARPDELRALVRQLVDEGHVEGVDPSDPLGFLVESGAAETVVDAAYRFCRHEPGLDVTLIGTGSVGHLEANIASIERGPLPDVALQRLEELFGHIDHVTGQLAAPPASPGSGG